MRYGVIPTSPLEIVAAALNKIPYPILDVLVGPIQAWALVVASDLEVLGILAAERLTAAELATRAKCDEECLRLVLRVVRTMGYVALARNRYHLTAMGRRHFGAAAAEPYAAFARYGPSQWRMLEHLGAVVRSGQGIDFHAHQTPEEWRLYQAAMLENAKGFGWFVAERMPVPRGAVECIDIAGSHGYVSAALCRRHHGLRATVIERAEALEPARQLAIEAGHADLVRFREGDLLVDKFGTDVDVALLSNILHHFPAETNRDVLRRVHAALRPGGTIGVFDIETPSATSRREAAADALALYFRLTSTSTCFRAQDYLTWLADAGFAVPKVIRSVKLPSRMLITARKN
jgi:SAM-dependent methyltransferase